MSILVASYIKGDYADGVAGDEVIVRFFIIEGEGEDAVQLFKEADAFVFVKGKDGGAAYVDTTPVRSAMTDFLRHP